MNKTEEKVTVNEQNKAEKTMPPDKHWYVIILFSREWNVFLS